MTKYSIAKWHQILGPRFSLARDFSGVHSIPDAIKYCQGFEREKTEEGVWTGKYKKKEGSGEYEEFGSYQPGKREDLLGIKRRIDDFEDPEDIVKDAEVFNTMCKHMKFFKQYQTIVHDTGLKRSLRALKDCREMPKIYIRYGPTRTGKTRWIEDTFGKNNVFGLPLAFPRWVGDYDRHTHVALDEFTGYKNLSIEQFCYYFDRQPRTIEFKGGHTTFKPTVVVITSNREPSGWWPPSDEWPAFVERVFCCKKVYKRADGTTVEECQEEFCKHGRQEEAQLQNPVQADQEEGDERQREVDGSRQDNSGSGAESD